MPESSKMLRFNPARDSVGAGYHLAPLLGRIVLSMLGIGAFFVLGAIILWV